MSYIIGFVAKPLGMLLFWIYQVTGNYGLSLIILTFIVKTALYPLYAKQIKSTAAMGKLQPKMKQIQQKYANDRETMSIKMQELYKEEGINPAGGCLPMLIQMPIIFGLFALLRNPMLYLNESSEMLFAVHESFLWLSDLSQPDKWILPILAGVATYVATAITMKSQTTSMNGMGNSMKFMQYALPVMIVFMGRSFPGGLAIYWSFGQFLQIFFNLHLNKVRKELSGESGNSGKKNGGKK